MWWFLELKGRLAFELHSERNETGNWKDGKNLGNILHLAIYFFWKVGFCCLLSRSAFSATKLS